MSEPVTTQPKSGDTLKVELPDLDFQISRCLPQGIYDGNESLPGNGDHGPG